MLTNSGRNLVEGFVRHAPAQLEVFVNQVLSVANSRFSIWKNWLTRRLALWNSENRYTNQLTVPSQSLCSNEGSKVLVSTNTVHELMRQAADVATRACNIRFCFAAIVSHWWGWTICSISKLCTYMRSRPFTSEGRFKCGRFRLGTDFGPTNISGEVLYVAYRLN